MITIKISRSYRPWFGGAAELQWETKRLGTLAELLSDLQQAYPSCPRLPEDLSRLRAIVLFYSDGHFLRPQDVVPAGAVLELLPPTAGG
jgi:molybdopterin converting factor small subunit